MLTFSTSSRTLNQKIKNYFIDLQTQLEEFSEYKIITAFRRNKSLKYSFVHASLRTQRIKNNPHQKRASFIFNRSSNLGAPVTQDIDLETCNAIYLIECQKCKMLYTGETKNGINKRLKQHIYYTTKTTKTYLLYSYFREHGSTNLRRMGVESSPTWTLPCRLARKTFWIKRLDPPEWPQFKFKEL